MATYYRPSVYSNTTTGSTITFTNDGWTNVGYLTANDWYPTTAYTTGSASTTIRFNEPVHYEISDGQLRVWNDWMTTTTGNTFTIEAQEVAWERWYEDDAARERAAFMAQQRADARQREREDYSRRQLELATKMEGAQERAMELLEMLLTPEEQTWREVHPGEIAVRGSDGGLYVIEMRSSVHGNIRQVDEHGCVLGRVCVAPGMYDHEEGAALPLADGWVGQYLAIKHQEQHLRETGNWSGRGVCRHPEVPILGQAA